MTNDFTLYADGFISYKGTMLYVVRQTAEGTRVFNRITGKQVKLPKNRYTLSTSKNWNGKFGRNEFFSDLEKSA